MKFFSELIRARMMAMENERVSCMAHVRANKHGQLQQLTSEVKLPCGLTKGARAQFSVGECGLMDTYRVRNSMIGFTNIALSTRSDLIHTQVIDNKGTMTYEVFG